MSKDIDSRREKEFGDLFCPSVSNCFMLDARMPARRLVSEMQKEMIYIGRVWAAWPTHARITVGTRKEMAKFKTEQTENTDQTEPDRSKAPFVPCFPSVPFFAA